MCGLADPSPLLSLECVHAAWSCTVRLRVCECLAMCLRNEQHLFLHVTFLHSFLLEIVRDGGVRVFSCFPSFFTYKYNSLGNCASPGFLMIRPWLESSNL